MIKKSSIIKVLGGFCLVFLISSAYADTRFIDNGDGTVTDTSTNLMWAAQDNMGDISWRDAKNYCENPPLAGYRYSNWRMPTIKELRTLFNESSKGYETDCGLTARLDPAIHLSCSWVWACEYKAISAYAFSFRRGYQYTTLMLDKKHFRALPVRNLE
ncbi:MAG: DUF1566 domain-containing protein [Deltaproteobacteria bacterium]|nr:DUF1566 domain-containing protein [Deltaproteobacteria bacterium]